MPGHILNLVIPWTSFYTVHKYSSCLVDRIVFSRHRIFFSLFRWNYLQWWTLGLFIANMQILVSTSDSEFEFSKVGLDILYHKNRFLENLIEKNICLTIIHHFSAWDRFIMLKRERDITISIQVPMKWFACSYQSSICPILLKYCVKIKSSFIFPIDRCLALRRSYMNRYFSCNAECSHENNVKCIY